MGGEFRDVAARLREGRWSRVLVGIGAGCLLAAVFVVLNHPIYESIAALSPRPENHAETGTLLTWEWAAVYFLLDYLLPVALVYAAAGRGWSGWAGVAAYVVVWWHLASAVQLGASAESYLLLGVFLFGFYRAYSSRPWSSDPWAGAGFER